MWVETGDLPVHPATSASIVVETVEAGPNVFYPKVKTFDPTYPGAPNAWYNRSNGRFCVFENV